MCEYLQSETISSHWIKSNPTLLGRLRKRCKGYCYIHTYIHTYTQTSEYTSEIGQPAEVQCFRFNFTSDSFPIHIPATCEYFSLFCLFLSQNGISFLCRRNTSAVGENLWGLPSLHEGPEGRRSRVLLHLMSFTRTKKKKKKKNKKSFAVVVVRQPPVNVHS